MDAASTAPSRAASDLQCELIGLRDQGGRLTHERGHPQRVGTIDCDQSKALLEQNSHDVRNVQPRGETKRRYAARWRVQGIEGRRVVANECSQ